MNKYIAFDKLILFENQEIKLPCKFQEIDSDLIEVYFESELYYKVANDYDFDNFRNQYIMVDNKITEFTNIEASVIQAKIAQYQSLQILKAEKIKLIDELYSKALILQIENGFTFQIDLRSKYGTELLNIVANSIGSYTDEVKSKKITTFFVNVIENDKQKQIYCACYNWIWQYIFEELIFYVKTIKQLKENFIASIENSTTKELKKIEFNFAREDGIKINVSKTIQKLLGIISDVDITGNTIVIPEFVKEAIRKENRELFKYSEQEEIKNNINTIVNKSWFQ
jgi:hypothetical protein